MTGKRKREKRGGDRELERLHKRTKKQKRAKRTKGAPALVLETQPTEAPPLGNILVFDCFSGIAGDMTIAALIAAGAPVDAICEGLCRLPIPPFTMGTKEVTRGGLRALYLQLDIAEEATYQPEQMRMFIRAAALPARVERRALAAVDVLERGEAEAHDTNLPHLHEAGGVDALIDIVGSMLALEALGIEQCYCPVVTVGNGTIARTEHGPIPAAPGPAAAHILQRAGFPLRFVEAAHELVTPTGAAILAAVAKPGAVTLTPRAHGAGAGAFDPPNRPNALRVFIGEGHGAALSMDGDAPARKIIGAVVELAANLDDMPAELIAHARDRLLEEGALDAWLEPIGMKKGRAGVKLAALVRPADEARIASVFFRETSTLGVRTTVYDRFEARRWVATVETPYGAARMKWREWDGDVRGAPEWEDVRLLAAASGRPALEIYTYLCAQFGGQG